MPNQVRGVLVRAMSGTELSRVRTEFRLRLPEPINKNPLESKGPTLLCNHVKRKNHSDGDASDMRRRFLGEGAARIVESTLAEGDLVLDIATS
jgi:hypothetical protein